MTPRFFHPLLALLASVTRQELARQVAYLREENRILRARLPKQVSTTPRERLRLIKAGRRLGLQLKQLISIVSYQSLRRWVREAEQGRGQRRPVPGRKPGRPRTAEDIREIVLRIRKESGLGYTRILGELRKLGIRVSRQTVRNILVENGLEPEPPSAGPDSWDAFLARHAATLWQCDFLTKPMWTATGLVDLYVMVWLHIGTRRCWISQCTVHPDSAWVCQQTRNFLADAEDQELSPTMVMRDNGGAFTKEFDALIRSTGATIKRNTPWSPNLRAHVERLIQSLKLECLDKFMVVSRRHLNHICGEWAVHYNRERSHSARDHLPPAWEAHPETVQAIRPRDVVCRTRLGGLLKSYARRAA